MCSWLAAKEQSCCFLVRKSDRRGCAQELSRRNRCNGKKKMKDKCAMWKTLFSERVRVRRPDAAQRPPSRTALIEKYGTVHCASIVH